MNKLELSPRLAAIAALVPQGARLADVGTDHAYLPVRLLLDGGIASAVATDVNEGPLQRGRETAERYGVRTILFRRCDGLADVRADKVDTVVIAGMGGDLIARILAAAPWTKQAQLILQPMTAQEDLRRWLLENGYRIAKETLAQEGKKLYVILSATGGSSTPYTPGELWAGRQTQGEDSPHRLAYLTDLIRRRRAGADRRAGSDKGDVEDMATVNEIYALLDQKAPFRTQLGFDNAGFLVGHGEQTVTKVLVALDITPEVIEEAMETGAQLIVAHHPVIWDKLGRVTDESVTGRKILTLIEHGIAAICAHTNLDAAQGGVNDALAQAVGLIDPVPLEVDGTDENGLPYGIGRVGELSGGPMSVQAFAQRAKYGLQLGGIRAMDAGVPVQKVAVGGGACGSMLAEARAMGCDTFLTADLKHDIYLEAKALGINLLDAGHYSTETVVCPVVAGWLEAAFPELQVTVSQRQGEVFQYF